MAENTDDMFRRLEAMIENQAATKENVSKIFNELAEIKEQLRPTRSKASQNLGVNTSFIPPRQPLPRPSQKLGSTVKDMEVSVKEELKNQIFLGKRQLDCLDTSELVKKVCAGIESYFHSIAGRDLWDDHHRQSVKVAAGLVKLRALTSLSENKKDLMTTSQFYPLLNIKNHRESAAGLIAALALKFDIEEKKFKLNEHTVVSFCFHNIAQILGIKDTGDAFDCNKSSDAKFDTGDAKFPKSLRNLRYQLNGTASEKIFTAADIREILTAMTIGDENDPLFRQLTSYYLIEQLLMPSSANKRLRVFYWRHVADLESFEKVNWAEAIYENLMDGFTKLKTALLRDPKMKQQHVFAGFAPIVETWFFEQVKFFVPDTFTMDPPLVQKYKAQRLEFKGWRFGHIHIDKYAPCRLCTSPTSPLITPPQSPLITPTHSPIRSSSPLITPTHSPIRSSSPLITPPQEHAHQEVPVKRTSEEHAHQEVPVQQKMPVKRTSEEHAHQEVPVRRSSRTSKSALKYIDQMSGI